MHLKSVDEFSQALPKERQEKIERRAAELIAEEAARQASLPCPEPEKSSDA